LGQYRKEKYDEAIELMTGEAAPVMGPSPRLITAMAQYQQGQHAQARETLAVAILFYDWNESKADNHDAWIAHVLRREAEANVSHKRDGGPKFRNLNGIIIRYDAASG
jgi:hypothetical protein